MAILTGFERHLLLELRVVETQGVVNARCVARPLEADALLGQIRIEQHFAVGIGRNERQRYRVFRHPADRDFADRAVLDRVVQVARTGHLPVDRGRSVLLDSGGREPFVHLLRGEGVRRLASALRRQGPLLGEERVEAQQQLVVGDRRDAFPREGDFGLGGLLVEEDFSLVLGAREQDQPRGEIAARDGQLPDLVAPADRRVHDRHGPVETDRFADPDLHGAQYGVELHGRQFPRLAHAGILFAGGREGLVQSEMQFVVDEVPPRTPREGEERIGVFVVEDDHRVGLGPGQGDRLPSDFVEIVLLVAARCPQRTDEQSRDRDISNESVHGRRCFLMVVGSDVAGIADGLSPEVLREREDRILGDSDPGSDAG